MSPPPLAGERDPTLESVVLRFEGLWLQGQRPSIDAFLPAAGQGRERLLAELVHAELEFRLKAGEPARVEEYLHRFPELARQPEVAWELVAAEYRQRARREPELSEEEYRGRFPQWGERLAQLAVDLYRQGQTAAPQVAEPPPDTPRYTFLSSLARGGMGEVWRGHDRVLNRAVAIKVLRRRLGSTEAARRFREEAALVARLQHPAVVPVHDSGELADGRPFFVMKLVEGRTLAELLHEWPPSPETLPGYLQLFGQVCQAVAFAHARTPPVLHRDLKPSNVMVGGFGEVQVMDWGLAKSLASRDRQAPEDDAETCAIATARTEAAEELSRAGDVLGTPAYMAPEQARGEIEALDERCDVFGLGAILCVLLTGAPPYRGSGGEARARAARGDLAEAQERLAACGADGELIQLAWVCLAPEQEARPRDAGVVAEAVGAYLAGVQERARVAERQLAVAQARALEARKRRRLVGVLAAAVLLLGLAGWLLYQQRAATLARREAAGQKALEVVARGRVKLQEGWQRHDLARLAEAKAEAEQAVQMAHSGDAAPAVRQQVGRFQQEASDRIRRAGKNQKLLDDLLNVSAPRETAQYVSDARGMMTALAELSAEEQYPEAFRRWEPALDWTAQDRVVARLRQEPEPVLQEILAALDAWRLSPNMKKQPEAQRRLMRIAAELDQNPRRRQVRALLAGNASPGDVILGEWTRRSLPWTALCELERGPHWRRSLEVRGQVDPAKEPVLSVLLLARASRDLGDEGGAEELLGRALIARPGEVLLLTELGRFLERRKPPRLAEAIACYKTVRGLRPGLGLALGVALSRAGQGKEGEAVLRELIRQQGKNPEVHYSLGLLLQEQGRLKEAEAAWRQAIRLKPNFPEGQCNLGAVLGVQARLQEAEAALRQAIRLRPDSALPHANLGVVLHRLGKWKDAEAACCRAIRLKPDLYPAHYTLGVILHRQGRFKDAEAPLREAIRLQPESFDAHNFLGNSLVRQGRSKEAEAAYREAIRLNPAFAAALNNLGVELQRQGRFKEAELTWRQAIRVKPDYPEPYLNLGTALRRQGRLKEAEAACREAIRLKPDYPEAHTTLGIALHDQRRFKEAEAAYREAIRLKADVPEAHTTLGIALAAQGRHKEAEAACREAIRLKPDYPEAHTTLGIALNDQRRHKEAEAACREAIRLKADVPEAHTTLGIALAAQSRHKEAEAACREAIRLKPDYPDAHTTLGIALLRRRQFKEAEAACREAIRLKPDFPDAHLNLGGALHAQGRSKEAEAALRQAIRLEPDFPEAYGTLASALRAQGKLREALDSARKAHGLGVRRPGWFTALMAAEIRVLERLVALDDALPAFLTNKRKPSGASEQLDLALLCGNPGKRLYAASARFYEAAFVARPALADDVPARHRYQAACSAALAGCGRGEDAAKLADEERARLRKQALAWLRADLAAWTKHVEMGNPAARAAALRMLTLWSENASLAGIRDVDGVKQLPEDEQGAWRQLWAAVAALRERAEGK
jgi:Flp pilus assembly protein TadD